MSFLKQAQLRRLIQLSTWFASQVLPGEMELVTVTVDDQLKDALSCAIEAYTKED